MRVEVVFLFFFAVLFRFKLRPVFGVFVDFFLLGFILNSGRSLVIVVNKWDGLSQEVKEQVKETLDFRLGFIDFAQ